MFYDEELGYDTSVAYCVNGDGNLATVGIPVGMAGDRPVMEMVCAECILQQDILLVEA